MKCQLLSFSLQPLLVPLVPPGAKDKNARAISKVVPTWQAVEGTAVDMCPSVLATKDRDLGLGQAASRPVLGSMFGSHIWQDTISNLKCRTTEFVSKAGLGSFVPSEARQVSTKPAIKTGPVDVTIQKSLGIFLGHGT